MAGSAALFEKSLLLFSIWFVRSRAEDLVEKVVSLHPELLRFGVSREAERCAIRMSSVRSSASRPVEASVVWPEISVFVSERPEAELHRFAAFRTLKVFVAHDSMMRKLLGIFPIGKPGQHFKASSGSLHALAKTEAYSVLSMKVASGRIRISMPI